MQWTIPKLMAEIAFVLICYTHSFPTVAKQWGVAMDKVHNMTIFSFCGLMVEKKVVFKRKLFYSPASKNQYINITNIKLNLSRNFKQL